MKIVLVSAVALIDPDGRVLLAQRPEGKSLAGLWEFPGGKVEPNESPETALIRELKDPRVGMVTINAVEVTPDYAHAQVYFSCLVGDPESATAALNQAAGFLRNGLFKRLHIHTVPTLHFHFDRTTERASDMNALIAKAVASRSKNEE